MLAWYDTSYSFSNYRTTTGTPRQKKSKSLAQSIDCVLLDLIN